jgi:RNA polymerase sigma-70 factor, ECF subfamily
MAWRIGRSVTHQPASRLLDSRVSSPDAVPGDDPRIVALVGRAVARDQAAFAELYDQYLTAVYRYVYYRTGHRTDAEDLTEQVFLQAWAAIERFRWQGRPFLAWLYTVARNVVIDWHRRAADTQSLDDADRPLDVENTSAAEELSRWIDADLLANAIKRLTPEQQQVITLKFLDGFDTARVAQIMDKREGTVRALQLRALQSLRRELERQGESLAA